MRIALITALLCLGLGASGALAQFQPNHGDSLPPIRAERIVGGIAVDGALAEPAWQRAPSVARRVQGYPYEGAAPTESTGGGVAYDDDALYVAARCWDPDPDSIVANLVRRDLWVPSDRVLLYLDPFHDHRGGYFFSLSAAGVLYDGTIANDIETQDASWDGVWEGRVRRDRGDRGGDAGGWTCEMRIPFSQLRFRPGAEQVWGINFRRRIERRAERDDIVYPPRNGRGFVSRFPHLVGIEGLHRPRSVEIWPYVTGKAEYLVREGGDPFHDGSRYTPGGGGDLRASVGNNLTLNVTANPDFGQVEVDPAVVNLSDVESFFEEKRPFFTENSRVFSFGAEGASVYPNYYWPEPRFFYTRRVGRSPQGALPAGAEYPDVPVAARILGAAKLTGKLSPSLHFGTLHALTSAEEARYAVGGLESRTEVEPLTYYGVTRGLREFAGGRDGLGLMATLAQRRLRGDLRDALSEQSLLAGLDGWHFLDRGKVWVLSGWAGMSRVAGSAERMIRLQRSSAHYLQRPDAGHLGVDSSATSLTGFGGRLLLNKEQGNVIFNSGVGVLDPKFDLNDLGYLSRADVVNLHLKSGYRFARPNAWWRQSDLWGAVYETFDFDGDRTMIGAGVLSTTTFANEWYLETKWFYDPRRMNDRRTRGGPLTVDEPCTYSYAYFNTDARDRTVFALYGARTFAPAAGGSDAWCLQPTVQWKPTPGLSLQVGPALERVIEDAQYVRSVHDPDHAPADFGGSRYVFARLDQTTVSAEFRLDLALTPSLSLQTFVQPFVSAGRYSDFKELARSSSYEFLRYGANHDPAAGTVDPDGSGPAAAFAVGHPDFNLKSLRGNAVLRWEYRPGSVLHFVWTQERTDREPLGELRFGPSSRRLLDAPANDIFLVKATYYFHL